MSKRKSYPSDLSDARWALIEPTLTACRKARLDRRPTGKPARVELRDSRPHDYGRYDADLAQISLRVATDVLPLLVNACSSACVAKLPDGAKDYIPTPHTGGRVDQPASDWN